MDDSPPVGNTRVGVSVYHGQTEVSRWREKYESAGTRDMKRDEAAAGSAKVRQRWMRRWREGNMKGRF